MKLCWTNIRLSARKESVNFCSTDFFYFLSGKQIMSQFDAKWPEVSCNPVHYFFLLFRLIWWPCYAQILTECIIKLTDSGFFLLLLYIRPILRSRNILIPIPFSHFYEQKLNKKKHLSPFKVWINVYAKIFFVNVSQPKHFSV